MVKVCMTCGDQKPIPNTEDQPGLSHGFCGNKECVESYVEWSRGFFPFTLTEYHKRKHTENTMLAILFTKQTVLKHCDDCEREVFHLIGAYKNQEERLMKSYLCLNCKKVIMTDKEVSLERVP